jgi:hypothetical protein
MSLAMDWMEPSVRSRSFLNHKHRAFVPRVEFVGQANGKRKLKSVRGRKIVPRTLVGYGFGDPLEPWSHGSAPGHNEVSSLERTAQWVKLPRLSSGRHFPLSDKSGAHRDMAGER